MRELTASWQRRTAAELVDGTLLAALVFAFHRGRMPKPCPATRAVMTAVGYAYEVVGHVRFGQTIGERMIGVRVVTYPGTNRPGWRAALVRALLRNPPLLPSTSPVARSTEEQQALDAAIAAVKERHQNSSDRDAYRRDLIAVFEAHRPPSSACLYLLARVAIALLYEAVVQSGTWKRPLRQGLHDRAAGVVVINA